MKNNCKRYVIGGNTSALLFAHLFNLPIILTNLDPPPFLDFIPAGLGSRIAKVAGVPSGPQFDLGYLHENIFYHLAQMFSILGKFRYGITKIHNIQIFQNQLVLNSGIEVLYDELFLFAPANQSIGLQPKDPGTHIIQTSDIYRVQTKECIVLENKGGRNPFDKIFPKIKKIKEEEDGYIVPIYPFNTKRHNWNNEKFCNLVTREIDVAVIRKLYLDPEDKEGISNWKICREGGLNTINLMTNFGDFFHQSYSRLLVVSFMKDLLEEIRFDERITNFINIGTKYDEKKLESIKIFSGDNQIKEIKKWLKLAKEKESL